MNLFKPLLYTSPLSFNECIVLIRNLGSHQHWFLGGVRGRISLKKDAGAEFLVERYSHNMWRIRHGSTRSEMTFIGELRPQHDGTTRVSGRIVLSSRVKQHRKKYDLHSIPFGLYHAFGLFFISLLTALALAVSANSAIEWGLSLFMLTVFIVQSLIKIYLRAKLLRLIRRTLHIEG